MLKGIEKVIVNDKEIEAVSISFQSFEIPAGSEDFYYVKLGKKDPSPGEISTELAKTPKISILLGFSEPHQARELFQNAPQFLPVLSIKR